MAKDLKFQGAIILFGTVIVFFSIIFLIRVFFFGKKEGFEDIQKDPKNLKCPADNIMVAQSTGKTTNAVNISMACYPEGLVNVDPLFMKDNFYTRVQGTDKSIITFYSGKNGTGDMVARFPDLKGVKWPVGENIQKFDNLKFQSIRVQLNPDDPKGSNPINPAPPSTSDTNTCNLSPAAKAAADAADAATAAAANAAAIAVGVDPDAPADPYKSATPSVFSVTCPSGDPIVAFGATKPPSLDSQLGRFGGAGVKSHKKRMADWSTDDDDDDLDGADPDNECQMADSQPADVDSECSIKPSRRSSGRNKYQFDPETDY